MVDPLHVGLLVERRYLCQVQPAGLLTGLQALGHRVTLIDPGAESYQVGDDGWLKGFDLVVARGRSQALLTLLAWAERRGIPTVNRRVAIAAVHNKAEMAVALASRAIATPRTYLGRVDRLASRVPGDGYPLILKPIFGDNGRGLRIVRTPAELATLEWPDPVALAQQYLPNDGYDLKLYGIGDEVWAVRKPSPCGWLKTTFSGEPVHHSGAELSSTAVVSTPVPLTPLLRDLGRRCGQLFGLDLYGVDCVETPDGPVVIEVNDFPNYTGVPAADEQLANYLVWRAHKEQMA